MRKLKLGVGPMSKEIIDAIISYKNKEMLMVVASRNQVDYKDGYVCDPFELALKIKPAGILLCRDHCGPYFKDTDKNLSLDLAIAECKKTIENDLKAGFDLIHIDVSKINDEKFEVATDLIRYAVSLNPNVLFEFGSEENTGKTLYKNPDEIIPQLEYLKQFPNVRYFVTQTGSLTKEIQAGEFDINYNRSVAEIIHQYGLSFKEHNADYLLDEQISLRVSAGIDAMNIAPMLGVMQTSILRSKSNGSPEWKAFSDLVYKEKKWERWASPNMTEQEQVVLLSGHYHFNSLEYKTLLDSLVCLGGISVDLEKDIHTLFDHYVGINSLSGDDYEMD